MPQLYRVLGLLVAPSKPCQIAQVCMYRWISIASASLIVHDFPDLQELFLDHGPIYRWATQGCIVFSTTSVALVMPTTIIPGDKEHYTVRQLTQDEINDPGAYFVSVMMQVLQFTSLFTTNRRHIGCWMVSGTALNQICPIRNPRSSRMAESRCINIFYMGYRY